MKHSALYDSSFRNLLIEEHEILSRADEALKNGEFKIYMQPKCNMRDGKIVGAEALVRWEHPQRGLIAPCVFIPVFEKNGFIKKLDIYMWEEAAKWLSKRKEQGEKIDRRPCLPLCGVPAYMPRNSFYSRHTFHIQL